jgi:hypothetical protein
MTDRQAAMTYGVLTASAVAIVLLIADFPTARNLLIAIGAGLAVGIGSWLYLERH